MLIIETYAWLKQPIFIQGDLKIMAQKEPIVSGAYAKELREELHFFCVCYGFQIILYNSFLVSVAYLYRGTC